MTAEVCDALQTFRKPQMLLIHGHGVAETQTVINLKRGTVKQEEDPWVSAAIPRYTTVPLCKCLGKACNSSVYACLGGCGPTLHVVSKCWENGDEWNLSRSDGQSNCFFIRNYRATLLCLLFFFFLKWDKKAFQNQESPPKTKDTSEKLQ